MNLREEDATPKSRLKSEAGADLAGAADDEMTVTENEVEPEGPASIDDLEDLDDLEELEDGDLDVVLDDDDDDVSANGDVALDDEVDEIDLVAVVPAAKAKAAEPAEGAAEAETDDDELLADEVEASLDVILAERLRGDDTEADEQDADDEEDEGLPNQLATVIPVRQPDEFLCQSCFLLKPPGQLADADHQLCRDCA